LAADKLVGSGAEIVVLENPKSTEDTRKALRLLSSASMVIGPDGWATQATAAMNVRLVIGMDEKAERLRKPFNAVVARPTWDDVYSKAAEAWFEKRYPDYLNTGNAADFIKCKAKEYMKSRYVDVGCSKWPLMNSNHIVWSMFPNGTRNLLCGTGSSGPAESCSCTFPTHSANLGTP
jgi:hypothetical protein